MKPQNGRSKKKETFTVDSSGTGKRLDIFVAENLQITRSAAQKMIVKGAVLVNGIRPSKTGIILHGNDILEYRGPEASNLKPKTYTLPLRVIAETPDYIVIDKPAGLIVHDAPSKGQVTLVDLLLKTYPELKGIGDDPLRPGIVHRLDKDASGIMVIARTQESFDSLKRQFKLRRVKKEYLILVCGRVTPSKGTIDLPIARPSSHSTKFVGTTGDGRQAVTNYGAEEYLNGYSLVRVTPETGRTHQIRVHFFSRGYPLVGDQIYKRKKIAKHPSRRSRGEGVRLMLHATSLEFRDLFDTKKTFVCKPDPDFEQVITDIASAQNPNKKKSSPTGSDR